MDSGIESESNETSRINLSDSMSSMEQLSSKESRIVNEQDSSSDTNDDIEEIGKKIKNEIVFSQTKEQKQKQNEEIVMETSLSSETGSWDAFIKGTSSSNVHDTPSSNDSYKNTNGQSNNHFFIDASSLLDDIEYSKPVFTSIVSKIKDDNQEKFTETIKLEAKPTEVKINTFFTDPHPSTSNVKNYVPLDEATSCSTHEKLINTIDLWMENAQTDPEQTNDIVDATENLQLEDMETESNSETNIVAPNEGSNNSSTESSNNNEIPTVKPSFLRSNTFELETPDDQLEFDRQDNERRQGSLVFQNSIHQYSGYTSLTTENILPTTPFNSIIQIKEPLVIHEYSDKPLDSLFYKQKLESKIILEPQKVTETTKFETVCKKAIKRDESTPIVSGGVSTSDFTPVRVGSPLTQRKIESTPIVTGILAEITPEEKPSQPKQPMPAWIVDLSQIKTPEEKVPVPIPTTSKSNNKSLGFYVDLNEVPTPEPAPEKVIVEPQDGADKKNIFSMIIDFEAPKKEMPTRLSQSLYLKKTENKQIVKNPPKPEDKKIIDDTITRRPKSSSNVKLHNRHSWNSSGDSDTSTLCHQRTYSIPDSSIESNNIIESPIQEIIVPTSDTKNTPHADQLKDSKDTGESFVRLSDLDKSSPKIVIADTSEQNINRMTRSIPETSWIENKLLLTHSVGCRVSSSKYTPRMTSSTPSSLHFPQLRSKSPGQDTDEMISEISDLSSMHSSMVLEVSTEETSQSSSFQPHHSADRLGHDLLRMFLEEISPDVTVEVAGRRIKAHKCILSSRCQYFAAMLSGGWVESAGNVISLQGFSYQAVHFAMCHIYSGAADIPDSISLVELATLADMLGLEGLKEIVQYTLKLKHCHLFHKPCNVCVIGVLECLPLAAAYGLDELYRKALRWITRYFVRVWPTRSFSALPRELIDKCYQQHVVHMSADNILETMLCCDKLLATLPNLRWAEIVHELVCQLSAACQIYLTQHLSSVLASASFLSLGKEMSWNISRLEGGLLQAADKLYPEQACKSYARAHKLLSLLKTGDEIWSPNFIELVERLLNTIEHCVVRQAVRVSHTQFWARLDTDLRNRIQELCCIPLNRPHISRQPRSSSGSRNLDLRQVRLAMQQHTRRTQSIDSRAKAVKQPAKIAEPPRPRTWPAHVNPKTKIISSSDSSRTSSPALKRVSKTISAINRNKGDMSIDSLSSPVINKNKKAESKITNQKPKITQQNTQKPKPRNSIPQTTKPRSIPSRNAKVTKEKTQLSKSLPTVNKENNNSENQSKSGSSSSAQYSPSVPLRNRQTTLGNQTRTNISSYSASPNLRRNLLLAAKSPQVPVKTMSPVINKKITRIQQTSHSLTSPTKSSAAKCVNAHLKNPPQKRDVKSTTVKTNASVERSGTFLKDEPTVLTKTS